MSHDELAHYGVKGMRWGRRKGRSSGDKTIYKKPPGKLTDAELKRRIQRLEQEKRYKELNKVDVSAGKSFATSIMKNSGQAALTTLATAGALYVGKMFIGNVLGIETMQDMFPKKKK